LVGFAFFSTAESLGGGNLMVAAFLCYIDRKKNVGEFGRTFVAVGRSVIKRESRARKGKERRKARNKV
jgi:fructose-1-phosphate kinase PfkB-like protein